MSWEIPRGFFQIDGVFQMFLAQKNFINAPEIKIVDKHGSVINATNL